MFMASITQQFIFDFFIILGNIWDTLQNVGCCPIEHRSNMPALLYNQKLKVDDIAKHIDICR